MTFDSAAPFDNDFQAALFLKILSYAMPCSGLILDCTEAYRDSEHAKVDLQTANDRIEATMQAAPNGMLVVDQNGIVSLANRAAEALLGYASHDLVGQSIEKLDPDRRWTDHPQFGKGSSATETGRFETLARRQVGTRDNRNRSSARAR